MPFDELIVLDLDEVEEDLVVIKVVELAMVEDAVNGEDELGELEEAEDNWVPLTKLTME